MRVFERHFGIAFLAKHNIAHYIYLLKLLPIQPMAVLKLAM